MFKYIKTTRYLLRLILVVLFLSSCITRKDGRSVDIEQKIIPDMQLIDNIDTELLSNISAFWRGRSKLVVSFPMGEIFFGFNVLLTKGRDNSIQILQGSNWKSLDSLFASISEKGFPMKTIPTVEKADIFYKNFPHDLLCKKYKYCFHFFEKNNVSRLRHLVGYKNAFLFKIENVTYFYYDSYDSVLSKNRMSEANRINEHWWYKVECRKE